MPSNLERAQLSATSQAGLLARLIRALRRFAPAAIASICIMPSAWAIPTTTTLSPLGPQSTITLSRGATNGAFSVDYDFTLATAASALYQTGRLNIVDPDAGTLRINQFTAQLFLLINNAISATALATGVDTGPPGWLLSNYFFAPNLAPGDYRLALGGIDESSGYDGMFRVTPPPQVQLAVAVAEPQSWALLLIALGSLMLVRRQPPSRRLRAVASIVARDLAPPSPHDRQARRQEAEPSADFSRF